MIGAKAAALSTSSKIKTRSKIQVRSKFKFASDKSQPEFTEINKFSAPMKPTKLLLRLVHVDGKMEENGTESPVNEEKQIVHESSDN